MTEVKFGLSKPEVCKLAQDVYTVLCDTSTDKTIRMEQAKTRIDAYNMYLDPAYPVYQGTLGVDASDPHSWMFMWIGTFQGAIMPSKYTMEIVVYSEPGGRISSLRSRCGIRLDSGSESELSGVVVERSRLGYTAGREEGNPKIMTFLGQLRDCMREAIGKLKIGKSWKGHINTALRQEILILSDLLESYWSLHPTCDKEGDKIMPRWDEVSQHIETVLSLPDSKDIELADTVWCGLREQAQLIAKHLSEYTRSARIRSLSSSVSRAKAKVAYMNQPGPLYTQLQLLGKSLDRQPIYSDTKVGFDANMESLEAVINEINNALPTLNDNWVTILQSCSV